MSEIIDNSDRRAMREVRENIVRKSEEMQSSQFNVGK